MYLLTYLGENHLCWLKQIVNEIMNMEAFVNREALGGAGGYNGGGRCEHLLNAFKWQALSFPLVIF